MIDKLCGYTTSFQCEGRYCRDAEHVVVLTQRESPTCDFYVRHRLANCKLPVTYWILGEKCPVPLGGAFLIVVRYLDRISVEIIERSRKEISGVAYLLDDDLVAAVGDRSLPLHYRLYMAQFWIRYARRLGRFASEVWAASDVLAERLEQSGAVHRIDPDPAPFALPCEREPSGGRAVEIFYHGQKTHGAERGWLKDVVAVVHEACPNTRFEITGGRRTAALYREFQRVRVCPPLSWPDYLRRSADARFDIGLAPLVSTPFNRARSWVKYLDISRFGAVGIYASGLPYGCVVEDGRNGLLRPPDAVDAWIEALISLVENRDMRERLVQQIDRPRHVPTPPSLQRLRG